MSNITNILLMLKKHPGRANLFSCFELRHSLIEEEQIKKFQECIKSKDDIFKVINLFFKIIK